jgi:hypothetical protein
LLLEERLEKGSSLEQDVVAPAVGLSLLVEEVGEEEEEEDEEERWWDSEEEEYVEEEEGRSSRSCKSQRSGRSSLRRRGSSFRCSTLGVQIRLCEWECCLV